MGQTESLYCCSANTTSDNRRTEFLSPTRAVRVTPVTIYNDIEPVPEEAFDDDLVFNRSTSSSVGVESFPLGPTQPGEQSFVDGPPPLNGFFRPEGPEPTTASTTSRPPLPNFFCGPIVLAAEADHTACVHTALSPVDVDVSYHDYGLEDPVKNRPGGPRRRLSSGTSATSSSSVGETSSGAPPSSSSSSSTSFEQPASLPHRPSGTFLGAFLPSGLLEIDSTNELTVFRDSSPFPSAPQISFRPEDHAISPSSARAFPCPLQERERGGLLLPPPAPPSRPVEDPARLFPPGNSYSRETLRFECIIHKRYFSQRATSPPLAGRAPTTQHPPNGTPAGVPQRRELGLSFAQTPRQLAVTELRPGSLAAEWNEGQVDSGTPERQLLVGDQVVAVNGARRPQEMLEECAAADILRLEIKRVVLVGRRETRVLLSGRRTNKNSVF